MPPGTSKSENILPLYHSKKKAEAGKSESTLTFSNRKPICLLISKFDYVFRSGSCSGVGRESEEDGLFCVDNLKEHLGITGHFPFPAAAFYGVFNGPGGGAAASIIREHIFNFIVEDKCFTFTIKKAIREAFQKAGHAFADIGAPDSSSITSALTVLFLGRKMLIASVGDYQAVMGRRGKEVVLTSEDLEGSKCSSGPLPAAPKVQEIILSEEDEFLPAFIYPCKGRINGCAREFVREALHWKWGTNTKNVVICFSPNPPPLLSPLSEISNPESENTEPKNNTESENTESENHGTDLGWMFLVTALCLETLSICCEQVASPHKPMYAIYGLVLAFLGLLASMSEMVYNGKRQKVEFRRWWFYEPRPPHRALGDVIGFSSVIGAFSQCVVASLRYAYIIRHRENPIKAELLPMIIIVCLLALRLIKRRNKTRGNYDSQIQGGG
ncbi:hypothetical protein DVH24_010148 [Malus domestica]|uniref:PPM-type phosphatase domain-containing protein n=1 Tax=Malus domestica TaxID=3750 RepID=A0A498JV53_MALDO|nr:hypothetical protein DVH24_010148 [Malus domestica]